jgi:hypothetical protein
MAILELRPKGVLAFQFDGKIQALVEHAREGVRRVKSDGRQHRHHFALEIVANPFALGVAPGRATQEADTLFGEGRQDHVVQVLVLLGDDGMGFGRDQAEGFLCRLAVDGDAGGAGANLFLEAGNPDFKKLVHVAGDDAQEAQAFEQGHPLILGLGQDAPVEGEQAEFAVQVVFGRKTGGQGGVNHCACSGSNVSSIGFKPLILLH